MTTLTAMLRAAFRDHPSRTAIVEGSSGRSIDYGTLDALSDRFRDRLAAMGVGRGDRVGLYLRKSIDTVAAIVGTLKAGAAYVPVDPTAPASRNAYIHDNCGVPAIVVERRFEAALREQLALLGASPRLVVLDDTGGGDGLQRALDVLDAEDGVPPAAPTEPAADDLAYILYTSGSTGKPKGVMLSHGNATAFVGWCAETFAPSPADVFSSHAPFHFDLSILDLYLPLTHGAACVLVSEENSKDPLALASIVARHRISVWYSAPSILSLLAQYGRLAEHDLSSLRLVLFAGEVFPVFHLRSLASQIPAPRYFNLYGPTETNVCTAHEVPSRVPADRVDPYPIGAVCSNLEARVVDADLRDVPAGAEGELCIAGPNVMQGYWALPEQSARGFLPDAGDGKRWYRTGDIVVEEAGGVFRFVGRRDRMIKKRGYRVELGEIEACLYRHRQISEAAVVALADEARGVVVKAHVGVRGARPSLIELKSFCAASLPLYMVPDTFAFHEALPKTSTDKIDYQALTSLG